MEEADQGAVESALEGAFGTTPTSAPKPQPKPAPEPKPAPQPPPGEPEELPPDDVDDEYVPTNVPVVEGDAVPGEEAAPAEPEFLIEVNGQQEVIRGNERVKELLQKGLHYSRGSEEVARVREQLLAQAQATQQRVQFQEAIFTDLSELRALDQQLQAYNQVDWNALIERDFIQSQKLMMQRSQLNEQRNAVLQQINQKHAAFQQGQAQAAQQTLVAENGALLAKLPEWRNSERRQAEEVEIERALVRFGFNKAEIDGLMDHRMLLVARAAAKYMQLVQGKSEKAKQVRDAPPVIKPGASSQQTDPHSRAAFTEFRKNFRQQGQRGQHRAQERGLEALFSRTFK